MSDLRETLDRALRTADPGEPPVDQAMRRGKGIRLRRRLTAVAGVVVVAAAAFTGYRSLSGSQAAPSPASPSYVTVTPPGPGSSPGLIASGTVGKQFWHIYMLKPTSSGEYAGQLCVYGRGSAFAYSSTSTRAAAGNGSPVCMRPTSPGDLNNYGGILGARTLGWFYEVAPDVAYVEINLRDGQDLKLIPAECYGIRLVAYLALQGTGVATITGYAHKGGRLVAVPVMAGMPYQR